MATVQEKAAKKIGDAYFGEGAAIGDGAILKMLIDLFAGLIGGCPFGAKQAHRLVNGNRLQQNRARRQIKWAAYDMTGDEQQAEKMADVGMSVGQDSTEKEFVEFAG